MVNSALESVEAPVNTRISRTTLTPYRFDYSLIRGKTFSNLETMINMTKDLT